MTIAQLLRETCEKIEPFDAEFLLADVLHVSRAHLREYPDHVISKYAVRRFHTYVNARAQGIPIPYVVKYMVFCNLAIGVTKDVMIPRSTTEQIVELVLQEIKTPVKERTLIIDVGTGSGCIPIAIGKYLDNPMPTHLFATDISQKALLVAKKNAAFHEVPIEFFRGDLLLPILEKRLIPRETHVILTAHLPYISTEKIGNRAEPKVALDGGADGLDLYRQLFFQIQGLVSIPKIVLDIFCECAPKQIPNIITHIEATLPGSRILTHADDTNQERIIHVSL